MAGFAKSEIRLAQPPGWFDQLAALLSRELAPSSRKFRTAFRLTTDCDDRRRPDRELSRQQRARHLYRMAAGRRGTNDGSAQGRRVSDRRSIALAASVVMAGILSETPWLMLPFLFAVISLSTYFGTTRKLGAALLLIQVVCLDTFYSVVFAPGRNRLGRGRRIRRERDRLRYDRPIRQLAVARPRRRDPAGIVGSERRARSFAAARGFRLLPGSPGLAAAAAAAADLGSSCTHGSFESSRRGGCVRASPGDPACGYHASGAHWSRS